MPESSENIAHQAVVDLLEKKQKEFTEKVAKITPRQVSHLVYGAITSKSVSLEGGYEEFDVISENFKKLTQASKLDIKKVILRCHKLVLKKVAKMPKKDVEQVIKNIATGSKFEKYLLLHHDENLKGVIEKYCHYLKNVCASPSENFKDFMAGFPPDLDMECLPGVSGRITMLSRRFANPAKNFLVDAAFLAKASLISESKPHVLPSNEVHMSGFIDWNIALKSHEELIKDDFTYKLPIATVATRGNVFMAQDFRVKFFKFLESESESIILVLQKYKAENYQDLVNNSELLLGRYGIGKAEFDESEGYYCLKESLAISLVEAHYKKFEEIYALASERERPYIPVISPQDDLLIPETAAKIAKALWSKDDDEFVEGFDLLWRFVNQRSCVHSIVQVVSVFSSYINNHNKNSAPLKIGVFERAKSLQDPYKIYNEKIEEVEALHAHLAKKGSELFKIKDLLVPILHYGYLQELELDQAEFVLRDPELNFGHEILIKAINCVAKSGLELSKKIALLTIRDGGLTNGITIFLEKNNSDKILDKILESLSEKEISDLTESDSSPLKEKKSEFVTSLRSVLRAAIKRSKIEVLDVMAKHSSKILSLIHEDYLEKDVTESIHGFNDPKVAESLRSILEKRHISFICQDSFISPLRAAVKHQNTKLIKAFKNNFDLGDEELNAPHYIYIDDLASEEFFIPSLIIFKKDAEALKEIAPHIDFSKKNKISGHHTPSGLRPYGIFHFSDSHGSKDCSKVLFEEVIRRLNEREKYPDQIKNRELAADKNSKKALTQAECKYFGFSLEGRHGFGKKCKFIRMAKNCGGEELATKLKDAVKNALVALNTPKSQGVSLRGNIRLVSEEAQVGGYRKNSRMWY